MLNWILIIIVWGVQGTGEGPTSIRVSSKESCEAIAKQLPGHYARHFDYICVEDKAQ